MSDWKSGILSLLVKQSATMLAAKRSAGVAPEVNLGEYISHMPSGAKLG